MFKLNLLSKICFCSISVISFVGTIQVKAGGLKDLYKTSVQRSCTLESSTYMRIVNDNGIDQFRYCIISNNLYELTLWKRSSKEPTLRNLGTLGNIVNIQGKVHSKTGRLMSANLQRQYELEEGNIILYQCEINACRKKIIERKVVAYPLKKIDD